MIRRRKTYCIEAEQVPLSGHVAQSNGVGLVADSKSNLDEKVHDHESTSTESVGQNLKSIGNEQTRPGDGVADVKEPDEGDLRVAKVFDVFLASVLKTGSDDGPDKEREKHACIRLVDPG
jgi:hypothetical protein